MKIFPENKKYTRSSRQKGAAMLVLVIFFLFLSLAIITGLVSPTVQEFKNSNNMLRSRLSFFLSESGAEDAYFRLKTAKTVVFPYEVSLGEHTATNTLADSGYNEKTITSSGDVAGHQRKNKLVLTTGDGVSFNYGIQSGVGGFTLGNATVNGNVYSNGNIIGSNGAIVTGSAFVAGSSGIIDNVDVGQNGKGDAWAHTVNNSNVQGSIFCKTGSNNNKACNTSQPDPASVAMPITDSMVEKWKMDAETGGVVSGNVTISSPTSLGPKKITGNLAINADLTITGTVYVVGNITTANGARVSLSSSYGEQGGIIVSDGRVVLSNNAQFIGSGAQGTYILLVTTSACPSGCSGLNAVEVLNNVGAILINAQNGTVHLNNNVTLNEVVGNKIIIDNSAQINYLSGLANENFSSGPAGGWNVDSWKEVE